MVSENTIYFYPGRGGHSHDGDNSSFIDTSKYSLFDFSWGFLGDPSRIASQTMNYNSFQNFIVETVNNAVLRPAGLVLQPGIVNGSAHIISRSIEANSIVANTLTANEISANTITSNELAANFVLVNTIIASSNFNGTFNPTTFELSNVGTTGWAISSAGDAVFSFASIRGTIVADALYINDYNFWSSNGSIYVGDVLTGQSGLAYTTANGLAVNGFITATGGSIASFSIIDSTLYTGNSFIGWISLGPVNNAAYGGVPAGEIVVATRDPDANHDVRSTMRGEYIQVLDTDDNRFSYMDRDGFATDGTVVTSSVIYPYGAQQIAFRWSGSNLYVVIDGTTEYLLSAGGGSPAVSTVSPAVSPAVVSPAVVSPAVVPCVPCPTTCCAEGQYCFTIKGESACI